MSELWSRSSVFPFVGVYTCSPQIWTYWQLRFGLFYVPKGSIASFWLLCRFYISRLALILPSFQKFGEKGKAEYSG